MRIFVTGGTGFVGSHFVRQALVAGHEILALRRSKESEPRVPLSPQPTWVDMTMNALTPADFSGADVVVHFAAHSANVPYDNLVNCMAHNVMAPLKMAETAVQGGVSRFIVAGSCFEYGGSALRYEFIPPDAPLEPTLTYPASKAAASIAFRSFAFEHKVHVRVLRIFQVYGEGEAPTRFWPSLKKAALEGADFPMTAGEQIRDFIPVERVAAAFLAAAEEGDVTQTYASFENLGTGNPKSVKDFAQECWTGWNAPGRLILGAIPYRQDEIMRYVPLL